jgi:hypothetical protein
MDPNVVERPFEGVPGGLDIAHWWFDAEKQEDGEVLDAPARRFLAAQSADGFMLWRGEGADRGDYCYVWMEAYVDLDLDQFFLLDVRTKIGIGETRDYLFVAAGWTADLKCEWENLPIAFRAPSSEHRDRFVRGMGWFADLIRKYQELAPGG